MRRFFLPDAQKRGEFYVVQGQDFYHLTRVLRLKDGQFFEGSDGHGSRLKLGIVKIGEDFLEAQVVEREEIVEVSIDVTLFQAVPKQGFEEILEFCTEVGVKRVVPVLTERTVVRWDSSRQKNKKMRWERLVRELTKKVGRTTVMDVADLVPLSDLKSLLQHQAVRLVPWELEKDHTLKSVLDNAGDNKEFELCIGPEGGFSVSEIEFLSRIGFESVSLGERILRVKTASMFTLSTIFSHFMG